MFVIRRKAFLAATLDGLPHFPALRGATEWSINLKNGKTKPITLSESMCGPVKGALGNEDLVRTKAKNAERSQ